MKQFGLEQPLIGKWRQRVWYITKKARDLVYEKFGGKKISRERPDAK